MNYSLHELESLGTFLANKNRRGSTLYPNARTEASLGVLAHRAVCTALCVLRHVCRIMCTASCMPHHVYRVMGTGSWVLGFFRRQIY
jgi:hypothetical protein